MGISFTPEQQKVIDLRDRNILVSAAAGSGKTAVLVERIVKIITDETHPVDIDRLLVVSFTKAAAAEMRERISQAISKRLELTPDSIHLQRQATLLHNAQITTIDSFCLFIIRNNFNDIGIDPGFRVADENEMHLLKQDVMAELLEQSYQEKEQKFLDCVEYFTGGSNDKMLEEYICKLYDFSMSYPWPEDWIAECASDYRVSDVATLEKTRWVQYLINNLQVTLQELLKQYEVALRICQRPDGPYMYGSLMEQEKEMVEKLSGISRLTDFYQAFETITFGRLSPKKDETVNPIARERVQQLRNGVKKQLEDIRETYFLLSPEQIIDRMKKAAPSVETLLSLVLRFKELLDAQKRRSNMIDFSDMEHLALQILMEKDEAGQPKPTLAAQEYRQYFAEIMIDEYQDSNLIQELLLKSISGEEDGNYNRFMVGDVKQSIYKFRLARPELFVEKYNSYSHEDSRLQRIDLHKNFRSRPEILKSVNWLFRQIMNEQLGGIDYDEAAALHQGAAFPEMAQESNSPYETEYLLGEKDTASKLTARQQEAEMIGARIKKLYSQFQVTDKETGRLRPVRYSDIVILLRTTSGWAEEFKGILEQEGIPAYVTSHTGYFQAKEIRVILQFLHVIDNPLQDIPLYGTMRSFFGGFCEEDIALLRARDKSCALYELLTSYEGPLQGKIDDFLDKINRYRRKTAYTPIHRLLQEILSDTGYLDYVTARPGGQQRRANVEMLLTKATAFESTSYYGLFHFLRYVQQLEKYEVDYGEADVLDEHADVVRIMSIHKSKGLEFPVCFVAGLAKKFNMQDATGRLIADADMGIGVDYVDNQRRLQSKTLKKNTIAMKMKQDALGEEMRVLYVAMTRAKEKLIMTAVVADSEKLLDKLRVQAEFQKEEQMGTGGVAFSELSHAGSYIDFLSPCLTPDMVTIVTTEHMEMEKTKGAVEELLKRQGLLDAHGAEEAQGLIQRLEKQFSRQYPYEYLSALYVKTTVSELKKRALSQQTEPIEESLTQQLYEEPEVVPYIPAFIADKEEISGTDRGSAYHKVMELFPMEELPMDAVSGNITEEDINRQMDLFVAEEKLTEQWRNCVSAAKIKKFFESRLADRMVKASQKGKLYREQPFVLGISANRLGEQFPSTEQILIQGIIDVFFEENGEIVVADYKTDLVKTPQELIERYQVQLDYYAEALERLTGKAVVQKIIYSFALGQEIYLTNK